VIVVFSNLFCSEKGAFKFRDILIRERETIVISRMDISESKTTLEESYLYMLHIESLSFVNETIDSIYHQMFLNFCD
jgi:hypothetical protein